MNLRMIIYMIGQIVRLEAALLLLPLVVALCYGENCGWAIAITAVLALGLGVIMTLGGRPKNTVIYAPEGFVITALAWTLLSAIGALPFVISGEIPSYVDAFFETVSGFTTTGASILTDVEAMSHGLLFWRSFTHWIGGMGVLVLMMAILPSANGRTIHIMRAEMPGPVVGKLVPRVRDTAKILYLIYIGLTVLLMILLLCGGMSLFDSAVYAMGTAGTGGFGIKASSVGGYSPYLQWIITIFMFLFGINFNLYYLLLIRRFKAVLKSGELWCYIGIISAAIALISLNIRSLYDTFSETFRHAAFQVVAIVTTTGFSTTDFELWPSLSKGLIFLLLFVGGCVGSTAGGLKISRLMLLFKQIRRNLRSMLHPRSVGVVKMEGKPVDEVTLENTCSYFALYAIILALLTVALSFEPFGFETNFSAAVTCFNNVGPGFNEVGPSGSFAVYSPFSKLLLSLAMLLGRLEIYPILLALSPATYFSSKKRKSKGISVKP